MSAFVDGTLVNSRSANTKKEGTYLSDCENCMIKVKSPYENMEINDKYKHCMVGGLGAEECGVWCARIAAIGKELQDATDNKPDSHYEIKDTIATHDGIQCYLKQECNEGLQGCCEKKGHSP